MIVLTQTSILHTWPLCIFLFATLLSPLVAADDALTKELESKMKSLLEDHMFGLPTYASEALLEIESSPDSVHWFQGTAKFKYYEGDRREYRSADWNLNPIDDSKRSLADTAGRQLIPAIFDFTDCSRSMMKYEGAIYDLERVVFDGNPGDKWQVAKKRLRQSSCVAIDPLTWPFIYTTAFSRGRDQGKSLVPHLYGTSLCGSATQIDSRTIQSVWYSKATTPDGRRLMFYNITFVDELPTVIEIFSYQAGFRDISELPDRRKCRLSTKVQTTWTHVDDAPVPAKVVAQLQNAGLNEVNELNLTVNLRYWTEGAKEYQALKTIADQAVVEIDKINALNVSQ